MFTTLLCIAFFKDLSFDGLTLQTLFNWFCGHPFLFLLVFIELLTCKIKISVR